MTCVANAYAYALPSTMTLLYARGGNLFDVFLKEENSPPDTNTTSIQGTYQVVTPVLTQQQHL